MLGSPFEFVKVTNVNCPVDIPFEDTPFKNSRDGSYQKKIVPALLVKTAFDLPAVLEFSRTYGIEGIPMI
jgi:hypothetical protein